MKKAEKTQKKGRKIKITKSKKIQKLENLSEGSEEGLNPTKLNFHSKENKKSDNQLKRAKSVQPKKVRIQNSKQINISLY